MHSNALTASQNITNYSLQLLIKHPTELLFNCSNRCIDCSNRIHIELDFSVIIAQPVRLLFHIIQLRIAKAHDARIFQQYRC